MKESKATGRFWRPEDPDHSFWGTLSFQPGAGTTVHLEGDAWDSRRSGPGPIGTLNGILFNGAPVSLFDGWRAVESYLGPTEQHRTQVSSSLAVVGAHFTDQEHCLFRRLQVRFSQLDQWFAPPYEIRHKRKDLSKSLLCFQPDSLVADFEFEGSSVRLETVCSRSVPLIAEPQGSSWAYGYRLVLTADREREISWFLSLVRILRELFVFLTGSGVFTLDLCAAPVDEPANSPERFRVFLPATVPAVVRLTPQYFTTRHQEVRDLAPRIVERWFARRTELEIAAKSYSELLCADGTSHETILLRTLQTLEHLHGVLWPDAARYVEKATMHRFVLWLREHFPATIEHVLEPEMKKLEATKEILLGRIGGLNEHSFHSRIERTFRELPEQRLVPLLDHPRELEQALQEFIARLEATRHFLTHFNAEQAALAFRKEDEVEKATRRCWCVLTYWLARALDIDEEHAHAMSWGAEDAMFLVQGRSAV